MNTTNAYNGPKYSVKYLGIVEGTMGVLSRKMAMQPEHATYGKNGGSLQQAGSSLMRVSPLPSKKKAKELEQRLSGMNFEPNFKVYDSLQPLLGGKYQEQQLQ